MNVKCIVREYFDRQLEKYVKNDEEFEIKDEKRAKLLIEKGFVKEVKEKQNKENKDDK